MLMSPVKVADTPKYTLAPMRIHIGRTIDSGASDPFGRPPMA